MTSASRISRPAGAASPRRAAVSSADRSDRRPGSKRSDPATVACRLASRSAVCSCSALRAITTASPSASHSAAARAKAWAKRPAPAPRPASSRGVTRAAGLPDAPPPAPAGSKTAALTPCARKARASAAPAIPAPMMATRGAGERVSRTPASRASSLSRLRPKPGLRSRANPAASSPRRTAPATV